MIHHPEPQLVEIVGAIIMYFSLLVSQFIVGAWDWLFKYLMIIYGV